MEASKTYSVSATESSMPSITPSFVTSMTPPTFRNIDTTVSENPEYLLGKWAFSETSCTFPYVAIVYFVTIKEDGTFTRGNVTEVWPNDNKRYAKPDFGEKQGEWELVGNEITLLVGPDVYVGKLDGATISGLITSTERFSTPECLYAIFNE